MQPRIAHERVSRIRRGAALNRSLLCTLLACALPVLQAASCAGTGTVDSDGDGLADAATVHGLRRGEL